MGEGKVEEKTRVWGKQGAEGWEWDLVLWWGWRRERWVRKVEGGKIEGVRERE